MLNYIIPAISLVLSLLAIINTTRYMTKRDGYYWISPFILSLFLFAFNLYVFLRAAGTTDSLPFYLTYFPLIVSILWFILISSFRHIFMKERKFNRFVDESKKNYSEAQFINKTEIRERNKKIREKKEEVSSSIRPVIKEYNFETKED